MAKKLSPILFFGSGPVAAKSLAGLVRHFEIEAVITKPTTKDIMQNAVGTSNVPMLSVNNKLELDELIKKQKFTSHLGIIVDFGIIISRSVIASFPLGILNSHFSLLPELRGADPISFAILEGQKKTGVSLMLIDEKLDEGPLICQKEITIGQKITSAELTKRLVKLSDQMFEECIPKYMNGLLQPFPQDLTKPVTYTRKLNKADGKIDWNKPAVQIEREIRGFIEWPRSYTSLGGVDVIITKAETVPSEPGKIGQIVIDEKNPKTLLVQCSRGRLSIHRLKPLGGKEMAVSAFLAGYRSKLVS